MTHEDQDERQEYQQPKPESTSASARVPYSLQGAVATSDHSHFHHHVYRPRRDNQEKPVRFKDSRAVQHAEKLREKLRERQLGGAAENIPESVVIPCQGNCGHAHQSGANYADSSSSEDAADEVLQRLLSGITGLAVGSLSSDSAVVCWDELDIEGSLYTITLAGPNGTAKLHDVETPHNLLELQPGTQYNVSICAQLGSLTGDPSECFYFVTPATAPSRPLPPRPGGGNKTSIQVKWNVTAANGSPVTHYNLSWDAGSGSWAHVATCSDRQYKITGLAPGRGYQFKVSAVNAIGESYLSEAGMCRTGVGTPNPPTCIYLGHASETTLAICWSPPNDNGGAEIEGYNVEQETEYGFISVYDGEQQECRIADLSRSTHYKFRVYSRNVAGQSRASAVVTFTTRAGLPPSPSKIRVEGKERSDSVIIAWDAPDLEGDQEILRYNMKVNVAGADSRQTAGADSRQTADLKQSDLLEFHTTGDTKFQVTGLQPGTLYRILVTLVTAGGEGPPSTPYIFKTRPVNPSAPSPPSLACKPGSYSLNLQWGPPSYTGGSDVSKYTLEMCASQDWAQLYLGLDTLFVVPSLIPGKSYKFRLRCHNAVGASLYSNTVNFATAPAPPNPPSPPKLVSKGPYSATITWQECGINGTPVTSYSVELCLIGGGFKEVYNDVSTSCVARDLAAGSTYYCLVKGNSVVGQSVPSEVTVYHTPPAPPESVNKIHMVESTEDSVTLTWDAAATPGSELLYYNVCFNGTISKCEENRFTASALVSDSQYKVRVQAVNTVGAGQYSLVKTVSTGTPLPPALPEPLQLLSLGHNFLKVSWTTVRTVKLYRVERKASRDSEYTTVYEGNKNQIKIGKLQPCTLYEVRVCGVNNAGLGPWLSAAYSTESVPPPPILKVNRSISKDQVKVTWQVKDKLADSEVFQVHQSREEGPFNQIYEGKEQQLTSTLPYDTTFNFKIRVKREVASSGDQEFGPFSQTLLAKAKRPRVENTPEAGEAKQESETESESSGFDDHQITVFILLALCLPALLASVYFIYIFE